ncbi:MULTISPECIES: DUF3622 domain-containing protein [unclassified Cycloclasticus]|jgi:hypothetical protein|uniref:DUF3622 domain-containing protein n=1 Tax=unclassified Cycloclasticus TaxID=2621467 RepID=UPI000286AB58|nr:MULTISPECIES: DUF3622 domain-containing protein [unclassified Cycloclasticus]AFT67977.1 Pressure regulated operon [Cycloclasticus sp. P1]MBV1898588.1 DUF3622 domain-containing protein [Cycloclasticus sp.]
MSITKKYTFQTSAEKDSWRADIIRRASSKNTVISKTQTGFKSEAEAVQWAEKELALFLKKQSARNKRQADKRT